MDSIILRQLGIQPYSCVFLAMQQFIAQRSADTLDEIWLVQHDAVFTQGRNSDAKHIRYTSAIPIIQSDRGGKITYHAPGQLVMYVLLDLRRKKLGVRQLVNTLEKSVIQTLQPYVANAYARQEAPGVYIGNKKICSLGLRITKGCSLHGLALNVDVDLTPFEAIHPCGYQDLQMTQLSEYDTSVKIETVSTTLVQNFCQLLGYSTTYPAPWNQPHDQ